MTFICGTHQVFIYERGGETLVAELTPVESVHWERVRDDISTAGCTVPTTSCCDILGDLKTIFHELHIVRNGVPVWEGPITRLEYEHDVVRIFAEDVLWQAKRKVCEDGYSQMYPNLWDVIDRMDWLLRDMCYMNFGDPWNVLPHLHPIKHDGDPKTSRTVNDYQFYVWEDFDKYAEDSGCDYTVVNRDIYYFDNHLAWNILPELDEAWISQFPRLVEYGNQMFTRGFVTNGEGYAGIASAPDFMGYGIADQLITIQQDGSENGPTPEEIAEWALTAANNIDGAVPAPVGVVIPEGTTLLPGAPWEVENLIPGSWFEITIDRLCRKGTFWQRLDHVAVTEAAPEGEVIQITAASPPSHMVIPPPELVI